MEEQRGDFMKEKQLVAKQKSDVEEERRSMGGKSRKMGRAVT